MAVTVRLSTAHFISFVLPASERTSASAAYSVTLDLLTSICFKMKDFIVMLKGRLQSSDTLHSSYQLNVEEYVMKNLYVPMELNDSSTTLPAVVKLLVKMSLEWP